MLVVTVDVTVVFVVVVVDMVVVVVEAAQDGISSWYSR